MLRFLLTNIKQEFYNQHEFFYLWLLYKRTSACHFVVNCKYQAEAS